MDYELHNFCLAIHAYVCPCGTTQLPLYWFSLNLNVSNLMKIFKKCVKKIWVLWKSDMNSWYLTWRCLCSFYNNLFKPSNSKNCFRLFVAKFLCFCSTFFQKSCFLWVNLRARKVTNDNIIQCLCFTCCITKFTGTHGNDH
jgi:hypothetical protein